MKNLHDMLCGKQTASDSVRSLKNQRRRTIISWTLILVVKKSRRSPVSIVVIFQTGRRWRTVDCDTRRRISWSFTQSVRTFEVILFELVSVVIKRIERIMCKMGTRSYTRICVKRKFQWKTKLCNIWNKNNTEVKLCLRNMQKNNRTNIYGWTCWSASVSTPKRTFPQYKASTHPMRRVQDIFKKYNHLDKKKVRVRKKGCLLFRKSVQLQSCIFHTSCSLNSSIWNEVSSAAH